MSNVASGESTMSRTQVELWYNYIKMSIFVKDARSGHASTSTNNKNIEAVKEMILDNRRITIREVAEDVLADVLAMKRAAVKIVSKLFNFEQKQRRMDFAQEMLTTFYNEPDLLQKGHNWWRIMGVRR